MKIRVELKNTDSTAESNWIATKTVIEGILNEMLLSLLRNQKASNNLRGRERGKKA